MNYSLNGNGWSVAGYLPNELKKNMLAQTEPAISSIPSIVPVAVQQDLLHANLIDNPYYGRNSEHSEWVNNREWLYQKTFLLKEIGEACQRYILCFDGLDFCGEVYLNNKIIAEFDDMFIPLRIDVTSFLNYEEENVLHVMFRRSPEVDGAAGFTSRTQKFKSRFNYFWDWSPRMVPVGIYDDVYIKGYNYGNIIEFFPRTQENTVNANTVFHSWIGGSYEFAYHIYDKHKNLVHSSTFTESIRAGEHEFNHRIDLENVELWMPNGMGEQPLYTIELSISENGVLCDKDEKKIGFRTVAFVQNMDSPEGALPYTVVVNGKHVFVKGVNWVPISMYYGTSTKADYYNTVKRFKDMNCNLLRVWGGAILEKKDFYDVCDELGIMVWQEFPQCSSGRDNLPPSDDPKVLENLKEIASWYVKRRRHHASHVIWCGGNELMYDDWRPVDFSHRNIIMLKEIVEQLDSGKFFLPISASGPQGCAREHNFGKGLNHDVHGPWHYLGPRDHYTFFNNDDSLFRSETGSPACASYQSILKFSNGMSVWKPTKDNLYWSFPCKAWIIFDSIQELFGEFASEAELKKYVDSTRFLQAESLKYSAEATLRRKGNASGYIVWMGNESYPNRCNASVLEFNNQMPKPAYYVLKNAFSTLFASVKYHKISYRIGETFEGELFLHSENEQSASVEVQILDSFGNILYRNDYTNISANGVVKLDDLSFEVCSCPFNVFFVRVLINDEINNSYVFDIGGEDTFKSVREIPDTSIAFVQQGNTVQLKNASEIPAIGIFLYTEDFSDISKNYITLLANEAVTVEIENDTTVYYEGYNVIQK